MRFRGLPLQLFVFTILPLTALLLLIAFGSLGLHQQAMRTMVGERDERATRAAAQFSFAGRRYLARACVGGRRFLAE